MKTHTPLTEDDYTFIWNAMDRVGKHADALKRALVGAYSVDQSSKLVEALTNISALYGEAADVQSALFDAWEAGGGLQSTAEQTEQRV